MSQRSYVVGAHWFEHAEHGILDTRHNAGGGYSGHYNWGLVDINNNPYPAITSRATIDNANVYYYKLGQADALPPIPLSPTYAAPVFNDTATTFTWRPVLGATSYTWQAAPTPDFASPFIVPNLPNPTYTAPLNTFSPGRWYWRVLAHTSAGDSVYTTPRPFFSLRQATGPNPILFINDFETTPDVTIQGQGPDYRWVQEVSGDMTMVATTIGVTHGTQAGLLTYSGQTNGLDDHYTWANISRYPRGTSFTPRDWTGYDYLSIDITNPASDIRAPLFGFGFNDDAIIGIGTTLPIRPGTSRSIISIEAALAKGMNPAQMADFGGGTHRPNNGLRIALDNLVIRQTVRDTVPQPAITPQVSDAQADMALFVDWRSYQPAPSTAAYLVYVNDNPNTPISSLTPTLTLDAVAQFTLLRTWFKQGIPGADPNGYNLMPNGQIFYVTVVAQDFWGNLGTVGPWVGAAPTKCGIIYSDVPPSNFAYNAISDLSCLSIVSGFGGGLFQPNSTTTRGQFAKMITLTRNWPLINPPNPTFSDVLPSNAFYSYVETAHANGAINGEDQPTCQKNGQTYPCFLPNSPVTRAQIAVIIVRAYGWPINTSGGPHFSDLPPGSFGYNEVETCFNRGVVSGIGGGLFAPNANATRAQVAVMLYLSLRQFQDLVGDGSDAFYEENRP